MDRGLQKNCSESVFCARVPRSSTDNVSQSARLSQTMIVGGGSTVVLTIYYFLIQSNSVTKWESVPTATPCSGFPAYSEGLRCQRDCTRARNGQARFFMSRTIDKRASKSKFCPRAVNCVWKFQSKSSLFSPLTLPPAPSIFSHAKQRAHEHDPPLPLNAINFRCVPFDLARGLRGGS